MKRIYLFLLLAVTSWQQLSAQCTLGNPGIKLNYSIVNGANCQINIDLYFDLVHNPGGKFVWVHIWPAGTYSNWNYSDPPTMANGGLTGSIATFGIQHQQSSLLMELSYPPDNNAPGFQYTGLSATEGPGILAGSERYTIRNVTLTIPGGCDIPQSFTADVWQSQSAQAQNVHCFSKGLIFFANDPVATGFINCVIPRTYSFTIRTISNTNMDVAYKVYIDDGDGIFNPTLDNIEVLNGSTTLTAAGNFRYSSGVQSYQPYAGQKPYADRDLWLQVTSPAAPNAIYAHLVNSCTPLPVTLGNWKAVRLNEWVRLQWTTVTEYMNKGFELQRLNGDRWETISFIPSAGSNGYSDIPLQYTYSDLNRNKVVSSYRLLQMDINGSITLSETRMVPGLNQNTKLLVYPNPAIRGSFNIYVAELEGVILIRLLDMSGRMVQQWERTGGREMSMQFDKSGVYLLQVQEKSSGRALSQKLVIGQ